MTIGINANSISKLAAQQAIDRYIEPLAEDIPERRLHTADRVIDNSGDRSGAGGGQLQLTEQAMNVSWILSDQQSFERAQNRCESRSKKTFAETANSFVGLNANECPVEISLYHCGLYPENLHS